MRDLVAVYGGLDILINTAALFPSSKDGQISDEQWGVTLDVNVTANYLLADEAARILKDQNLDASIVLTSSANAVVPKRGSEAYDVSKAALSHLVRELAISLVSEDSSQRHQPGHGDQRIDHVSARPRDCVAQEIRDLLTKTLPPMSSCGLCWLSFMPSARSRIARSIPKIARRRFCFWRDQNRRARPVTLFPWMVV